MRRWAETGTCEGKSERTVAWEETRPAANCSTAPRRIPAKPVGSAPAVAHRRRPVFIPRMDPQVNPTVQFIIGWDILT